jgi:hypothetical protein
MAGRCRRRREISRDPSQEGTRSRQATGLCVFRKRGAYARFKDLLHWKKALERWYDFENKATEAALREWCEVNDIVIKPGADPASEPDQR